MASQSPLSFHAADRTIGLVVLDAANPFFTDVTWGVKDDASRFSLSAILCDSDDLRQKETRYHELLEEHRGQGVLLSPVAMADARIGRLQGRGPCRQQVAVARPIHGVGRVMCSAAIWRCRT
jgi:DNA-binding LacI/PurR family transcriptional regulator